MPTEDWKYQVSLALPEGTPDATLLSLYDIIEAALKARDERAAKVLETRADELQRKWDAPPNLENGFIAMTADTPAGYATFWGMNNLRKLARAIRNENTSAD